MIRDAVDGKKAVGGGGITAQRKESSIELQKMMDSVVLVKCIGGREFKGVLRGYDDLVNLVLDDSWESIRDPETQVATEKNRKLGRVVVRGTQVSLISPQDGLEEIANPFLPADEDVPIPVGDS